MEKNLSFVYWRIQFCILVLTGLSLGAWRCAAATDAGVIDRLMLGNEASEHAHSLVADSSEAFTGGLNQSARRMLPVKPESWEGGKIAFTLKVDPQTQNYFTLRLWGSEVNRERLMLVCEGKQIGYRHLGEVDALDVGCEEPGYNGRFYYNTSPLPLSLTRGKSELHFEIRANGEIWGYGASFAKYQQPMKEPTRGLYAVYTHTDGCFIPPMDEVQGQAPVNPPVRLQPGVEVIEQVKARVNGELNKALRDGRPPGQIQMHFLAKAYYVEDTPAYHNPRAVERVVKGLDDLFVRYRKDPKLAQNEPGVYNGDWFGFGMAGDSVRLLAKPLTTFLDQIIDDGQGAKLTRRAAWSEMLQASRDWHRRHRRQYTNQSMITDMNIYRENRGIAAIDPAHALPEADMLRYLYEAIGLVPWLGSETDKGPEKPLGDHYFQLTDKGLTKELGFVGYYGEVLDWMTQIYDATREPGQPGDAKIKAQIEKAAHARGRFRYPMLDAEGNRALRAETIVGWRDTHFPGDVTYGERQTWDGSTLYAATATQDAEAIGYAQQMLADNQFFGGLQEHMTDRGLRITVGLLEIPQQYAWIKSQAPSNRRLPMTAGQPDFAWGDEEDGVVAIKHGDEILYTSLYWRARHAVNFLARVHYLTPTFARIGVVQEETEFESSGMEYTRPDWINWGFANGGFRYPGNMHSAHAGEKLPIAKIPEGVPFKPGQESVYAGKGSFYTLRYGRYLIAMNCTNNKNFVLKADHFNGGTDLVSGKKLTTPISVAPRTTVVFDTENTR